MQYGFRYLFNVCSKNQLTVMVCVLAGRYVKKETREFFGLDESSEENQRHRWQEKRKRLASRKYGQLKDQPNTTHHTQSFTSDFHALPEVSTLCKTYSTDQLSFVSVVVC